MRKKNKKQRLFFAAGIAVILGMINFIILRMEVGISRNIVNIPAYFIIVLSSFLISYYLTKRFWENFILSCLLMYLIYMFLYLYAVASLLNRLDRRYQGFINNITCYVCSICNF